MKTFLMMAALVAVVATPALAKDTTKSEDGVVSKITGKLDANKDGKINKDDMKSPKTEKKHKGHKKHKKNAVKEKECAPVVKARAPFND